MNTKSEPLSPAPMVYSVEEAARLLNLCRSAAYEAVKRGEIPSIRLGRAIRVPKHALDRLLEGKQAAAA